MDNNIFNISVSSGQLAVAFVFQMWMIIFPVILMIKVNRLTRLMEERFGHDEEEP